MFKQIGSWFLDLTETLVIGLSIFLVVYLFFMQPHQVNGQSMVPNLDDGDYLLTDKVSYRVGDPKRGDIVVFEAPQAANCPTGTGCDFIKRVIGVPGEEVEVRAHGVFINGQKLNETYLPDTLTTEAGAYTNGKVVKLQEDEYMVFGDNRSYSSDSRAWGPISKSEIIGKAFFRYWPPTNMGRIYSATYDSN
ncbi:signal peptidase I [Patescibacteria group bacterium]|nr:signal peptidase I [Patescibacteria group bacterium]